MNDFGVGNAPWAKNMSESLRNLQWIETRKRIGWKHGGASD
jgi:hypothetical protein